MTDFFDSSDTTGVISGTPAATAPAQPAQPSTQTPAQPSGAGATAPAVPSATMRPTPSSGVHGILGGIVMGGLVAAARQSTSIPAKIGSGLKTGLQRLAANSPRGQQLRQIALNQQEQRQRMQFAQSREQREQSQYLTEQQEAQIRIQQGTLTNHVAMLKALQGDQEYADAQRAQIQPFVDWMQSQGVKISDDHGAGHAGLNTSPDAARDVAQGDATHMFNGFSGQDAGVYIIDTSEFNKPITSDVKIPEDPKIDEKTGQIAPTSYFTIPADGRNTIATAYAAFTQYQTESHQAQSQYDEGLKRRKDLAETEQEEQKLTEGAQAKDIVYQTLNSPESIAGEKAPAAVAQLQAMQKDPNVQKDADRMVEVTRALSVARSAMRESAVQKQSEENAAQVARQGNPADAGRMLADGTLTIADLKSRNVTPKFIVDATTAAQQYAQQRGETYNASDEIVGEQVLKNASSQAFYGSANSLLGPSGTIHQAAVAGMQIPQNQFPIINKVEDWEKLARGQGPLAGYAATILGVADDYGKVMGGGNASDTARTQALNLIGASQSPEQRQAALTSIQHSVESQLDARIGTNRYVRQREGYNLPPKQTARPSAGQIPAGATKIVPGPDGKNHYTNDAGTVDYGVAQ